MKANASNLCFKIFYLILKYFKNLGNRAVTFILFVFQMRLYFYMIHYININLLRYGINIGEDVCMYSIIVIEKNRNWRLDSLNMNLLKSIPRKSSGM